MKLMFDTNIFNAILDGQVDLSKIRDKFELFVTHVQEDEIKATKSDERRNQLLEIFKEVTNYEKDNKNKTPTEGFILDVSRLDQAKPSSKIPTESFVFDTSNWDEAKWSDGNLYEEIKGKLDKRNKGKSNNIRDALIAETAMVNKFVLVTHDSDLFSVVSGLNCAVVNLHTILNIL